MTLNVDNWQELERVDAALAEQGASNSVIGIRINPQVGVGTIAAMSTATRTSKFGIALDDPGSRARILDAYRQRPWLTCVHTHVGSQGCPLELIAGGVGKAVALAKEINAAIGRKQVTTVDIGGGLPVELRGRRGHADVRRVRGHPARGGPGTVHRRVQGDHGVRPLDHGEERLHRRPGRVHQDHRRPAHRHDPCRRPGRDAHRVHARAVGDPRQRARPGRPPQDGREDRPGRRRPLLLRRRHHRQPPPAAAAGARRLGAAARHRRLLFLDPVRLQQPAARRGAWLPAGRRRGHASSCCAARRPWPRWWRRRRSQLDSFNSAWWQPCRARPGQRPRSAGNARLVADGGASNERIGRGFWW